MMSSLFTAHSLGVTGLFSNEGDSVWHLMWQCFTPQVVDPAVVRYVCCAALFGILTPIYASAIKMWESNFERHVVSEAIDRAMPHFAMGMLLLSIRV
jgi:hypothetical protein